MRASVAQYLALCDGVHGCIILLGLHLVKSHCVMERTFEEFFVLCSPHKYITCHVDWLELIENLRVNCVFGGHFTFFQSQR